MGSGDVQALYRAHEGALLRFAHVLSPHPYLRRVVLNTFRSRWRRPTRPLPEHGRKPPHFEDHVAVREAVWQVLRALSVRQRSVLILRYYEDLTDEQIAETSGCRRSTVRSLAARAMARLRADAALQASFPDHQHRHHTPR